MDEAAHDGDGHPHHLADLVQHKALAQDLHPHVFLTAHLKHLRRLELHDVPLRALLLRAHSHLSLNITEMPPFSVCYLGFRV